MKRWNLILTNFGGNIGGAKLETEVIADFNKVMESVTQDLAALGYQPGTNATVALEIDGKRTELHTKVPA